MEPFFRDLFEYNHHYNRILTDVFLKNPAETYGKAFDLFCHILNAHQIWNARIEPQKPPFGVWQLHGLQELGAIDVENHRQTERILDQRDLNRALSYTTSKGDLFSGSVRDILFHIINHSTYHRAQIATEFRLNGLEPLNTDYIFYRRRFR